MAPVKRTRTSASPLSATLAHRIHALLNTVRVIGHAEDELCTLLHEAEHGDARHGDRGTPALLRELSALIATLPAQDYLHDLEALEATLKQPRPAARKAAPARAQKPAGRKVTGKQAIVRKPAATRPAVKRRVTS